MAQARGSRFRIINLVAEPQFNQPYDMNFRLLLLARFERMEAATIFKNHKIVALLLACFGIWPLVSAYFVFDPQWLPDNPYERLLALFPPVLRSAILILVSLCALLVARTMYRIGRADNLRITAEGIGLSGFLGWRFFPWREVAHIGYRFEPIPIILVRTCASSVSAKLCEPVGTAPDKEGLTSAIKMIGERFPKLLEEVPMPEVALADYNPKKTFRIHLISVLFALPVIIGFVFLKHYDRELFNLARAVFAAGGAVFSVGIIIYLAQKAEGKDRQYLYIAGGLLLVTSGLLFRYAYGAWQRTDVPVALDALWRLIG